MNPKVKFQEIAARINVHLKRFESDPAINQGEGGQPYFNASAGYFGGRYMYVIYVSYQGRSTLSRADALAYLAWLDAGNVGKHFKQQRESARTDG